MEEPAAPPAPHASSNARREARTGAVSTLHRMSDKDQVKPYHARAASTGQETADAVADVLRHAAERDEAQARRTAPKARAKWMLPVALNLGLLAVYFLAAQPQWTTVNPIHPPPQTQQVERLRAAMYLGIARIQSYAAANGRLPATLEEAGANALVGSVDYRPGPNDSFSLVTNVGDEVLSYDSATMTVEEFTGPLLLPG